MKERRKCLSIKSRDSAMAIYPLKQTFSALMKVAFIFISVLVYLAQSRSPSSYILKQWSMNSTALSVTSVKYLDDSNHNHNAPRWAHTLMGNESVFWRLSTETKPRIVFNANDNSSLVIQHFFNHFLHPLLHTSSIPCSFQILGFAFVNNSKPFVYAFKHKVPSLGYARLSLNSMGKVQTVCYYRATYDNWRATEYQGDPNYWPMFLYCPMLEQAQCADIKQRMRVKTGMEMRLKLHLEQDIIWRSKFHLTNNPIYPEMKTNSRYLRGQSTHLPDTAVCTNLPYLTNQIEKRELVGAILQLWTKYYLHLGMQVMIYDAAGLHRPFIAKLVEDDSSQLYYVNSSILSSLQPSFLTRYYDNERHSDITMYDITKFDDDHSYSLTHCRFEASARYGIEHVHVVDFDEFFLCPSALERQTKQGEAARNMGETMKNIIQKEKARGRDQILYAQTQLHNRTAEPIQQCLRNKLHKKSSPVDMLDCYSSFRYMKSNPFHKSLHLSQTCPFTTDHHACLPHEEGFDPTDYDCTCNTTLSQECMYVHLSLRQSDYDDYWGLMNESLTREVAQQIVRESQLEIGDVLRSPPYQG